VVGGEAGTQSRARPALAGSAADTDRRWTLLSQQLRKLASEPLQRAVRLGFALPDGDGAPAERAQSALMEFVARGVAFEFRQPPFAAIRWHRAIRTAAMPVPEATVHEDNGLVFRQANIRFSGELGIVQPKAKTHAVEEAPDNSFRPGVNAANPAHVPAPALRCQQIHEVYLE